MRATQFENSVNAPIFVQIFRAIACHIKGFDIVYLPNNYIPFFFTIMNSFDILFNTEQ